MSTSIDTFPPEIMERIVASLPRKEKLSFRQVCRWFSNFVQPFALSHLKLLQVNSTTIQLTTLNLDQSMAQYFLSPYHYSLKTWSSEKENKINCFRKYEFPPKRQSSLFGAAKIEHLEISRELPIFLDENNVKHLISLFTGCKVGKATLVFDEIAISSLDKVPQFLATIQAKHFEIVYKMSCRQGLYARFRSDSFSAQLVSAGVREITLCEVCKVGNRRISEHENPFPHVNTAPPLYTGEGAPSNDHISKITIYGEMVRSGIERINVDSSVTHCYDLNNCAFYMLINKLTALGKPVQLQMSVPDMEVGRCEMEDAEKYGRTVTIAKSVCGMASTRDIAIEYNRARTSELARS